MDFSFARLLLTVTRDLLPVEVGHGEKAVEEMVQA